MKKVISIILGIMIFAIPVLSFADTNFEQPVILPQSDGSVGTQSGVSITFGTGTVHYYSSNNYPTYMVVYSDGTNDYILWFSEESSTVVYDNRNQTVNSNALSSEYQGFYYNRIFSPPSDLPKMVFPEGTGPTDVIDYVNNTVFRTTFDLSYITQGAVSWLSAVVNGVLQAPLLLFLILSSFIGIAVGLLFRFRRG